MEKPTVSIIIVTWNGRPLLERFLPSVLATEHDSFEVLVADNASDDGTGQWLQTAHPTVRLVRHPDNWLYARGNNAAVETASGGILCFLNNDVEVTPQWLNAVLSEFEDPKVVAVQPKLLQWADKGQFEYAGASGGFLDAYGYPFTRGRLFNTLETDTGQYDDARDIFWASGAAMFVRRDAFVSAGGFEESFGMHMEEIDLCWRLQRAGGRIRVAPTSEVYHLGGASLPSGNPQKAYLNYRNGLAMLARNLPADELRRVLRVRRGLDAVARTQAALSGNRKEAQAIARAWVDFKVLLPDIEGPSPTDRAVLPPYRRSIVLDYFVRGRRRFAQLGV